jgi:hypothetical protein
MQVVLFQQRIDGLIPQDSEVWIIDALIDRLSHTDHGFQLGTGSVDGQPGYSPAFLLKRYVYGYLNRGRTSRLHAHPCPRNAAPMCPMKGLTLLPDRRQIQK